nr:hypothetical protein [Pandoravirus aubagnensis]
MAAAIRARSSIVEQATLSVTAASGVAASVGSPGVARCRPQAPVRSNGAVATGDHLVAVLSRRMLAHDRMHRLFASLCARPCLPFFSKKKLFLALFCFGGHARNASRIRQTDKKKGCDCWAEKKSTTGQDCVASFFFLRFRSFSLWVLCVRTISVDYVAHRERTERVTRGERATIHSGSRAATVLCHWTTTPLRGAARGPYRLRCCRTTPRDPSGAPHR